ncbi:MFS multidrug transporter-like protein [Zopfia rhizophila CBS 207.26]|uniref:MFS multidrug transporter-like protein n=1 Tax=Zopfia rhizophila CBS 207.26 TaxID=1314779 RepID=A0A6A6DVS6_9PEZI|nr:MFS multidrug transporter-like protein [Zopfia rhizophila CBS 207.26]
MFSNQNTTTAKGSRKKLVKKSLARPLSTDDDDENYELPRFSFESQTASGLLTSSQFFLLDQDTSYDPTAQMLKQTNRDAKVVVTWDSDLDPANPLNWSWKRKWVTTILVSMFTFISPFSSTMVTPALEDIGDKFDIPEGFMQQLVMSIFLLGYAQGPFVLAPLSEIYGRVTVLQYANLIYLAFNTACGFAQNKQQLLAFRFLSGIGGSAPQALCNGVLADTWRKEERGKGQAIYGMLTFIGPCVAPICGAYISQNTSWRWIFWSTSLFDVLVQVLALFFLSETFAPTILGRKAKMLRNQTGSKMIRSEYETNERFSKILRKRLVLPLIMMFTHPAVQAPSIYRAYLYGVMYLVLSTFPLVWDKAYDQDPEIASLNYLSLMTGFLIGLQISHPLMDKLYARFKIIYKREEGLPEWRVPPMLLGGLLSPVGLFLYGWSAEYELHWIIPNIGCAILAIGLIIAFQCSQAYTVDAYSAKYAASAAAVGAFLRTMCGFSFPLFAPAMYDKLGLGWGNSLLGFLTLALAIVSPVLLWFYGAKIRTWSTRGLDGGESA